MKPIHNIFDQLKQEHKEVRTLFHKASLAPLRARRELVLRIEEALIPHSRAEEKTVYSLLHEQSQEIASEELMDQINESYEEHRVADHLLSELKQVDVSSEEWLSRLELIRVNVEHHIREEEEQLFSLVRSSVPKEEQDALLEAYMVAKERYMDSLPTQAQVSARIPSPEARDLLH